MTKTQTLNTTLIIAAVVLATAGCSNKDKFFPEEGTYRPSQQMIDAQSAAATRSNGNLYDCHFNDAALNSLGHEQLDAAIRGKRGDRAVVIHLQDGGDHDQMVNRMESVAAYLKDRGVRDEQIVFSDKFNDATYAPAAAGLASLAKTDTAADGEESQAGDYGMSEGLGISSSK